MLSAKYWVLSFVRGKTGGRCTATSLHPLMREHLYTEDIPQPMAEWHLIVGLGNPGKKYENTRHNIGWQVLDEFARRWSLSFSKTEHHAQTASGLVRDKKVILAKPQTFMNLSGTSVAPMAKFYKIDPAQIIVVNDDMDVPLGTLRLRAKGGPGGQKGLKDILNRMGTKEIARVRVGIGRPPGQMDPSAYVLRPFRGDDTITASLAADRASDALETWLTDGIELAMTRHNGSIEEPSQ